MIFFYGVAALTPIGIDRFAACAGMGGVVRAFLLSMLGVGLVDADLYMVAGAAGALVLMLGLALLSPTLRSVLFASSRSS